MGAFTPLISRDYISTVCIITKDKNMKLNLSDIVKKFHVVNMLIGLVPLENVGVFLPETSAERRN